MSKRKWTKFIEFCNNHPRLYISLLVFWIIPASILIFLNYFISGVVEGIREGFLETKYLWTDMINNIKRQWRKI